MDEKLNNQNKEITIPVKGNDEEPVTDTPESQYASDKEVDSLENVDVTIDQIQRLKAEFSNYKKRNEKERKSLFSTAKGELVLKLLPVLDDFERMLTTAKTSEQCDRDGVQYIYQNLKKCLVNEGMEEIVSVGESFDPHIHEAIDIEETDSDLDGVVLEEWKKGYTFGGKLLRPSLVKVGKAVDDERSDPA